MSKHQNKTKTDKTELRMRHALAPLIELAKQRGFCVTVAKDLTRRAGKKQDASNVRCYLTSDPAERIQPRLGIGLMLLDIQDEIERGVWNP